MLVALKGLKCIALLVIATLFIQSVDERLSNKSRTRVYRPKDTSQYNLKIPLRGGLFPPVELLPRMLRNGSHKKCHCRTLR